MQNDACAARLRRIIALKPSDSHHGGVRARVDGRGRLGTARIAVLTFLPVEFDMAREALGTATRIPRSGYYATSLDQLDVVLAKTDRTNVTSALAATDVLEDLRPEVLLVVGIAGGFEGRGLAPGDIVVPSYLHYSDFRSLKVDGDEPRHQPYDPPSVGLHERCVFPAIADAEWQERITLEPPVARTPPIVEMAPLVAGEKVFGDPDHDEQQRLLDSPEYSDAVAVDMESMGVARAIHRYRQSVIYNPRFLVIRGISDPVLRARPAEEVAGDAGPLVREDAGTTRARWRPYAAHVAAVFAAAVIERILEFEDERSLVRVGHQRGDAP